MRIVSLLPSATEIVAAIGCGKFLVGRSHECDYPEWVTRTPICSSSRVDINRPSSQIDTDVKQLLQNALSIYEVDAARLEELRPTHIVTQTQCDVCAVSPADVESALCEITGVNPKIISLEPHRLSDIWNDIEHLGQEFDAKDNATSLVLELKTKIDNIANQAAHQARRPTVGCIEWIEPLMAAGNWVPELIELAGGTDVLGKPGVHSPWLSWDELRTADPDVIINMPCGFDIPRTLQEMEVLKGNDVWNQLTAVRNNQVFVTDGNQLFNRPGPRMLESVEVLAEMLHPSGFEIRNPDLWRTWKSDRGES